MNTRYILLIILLYSALSGCAMAESQSDKESKESDEALQTVYLYIKQHANRFADIDPTHNLLLIDYQKGNLGFQHLRFQRTSQQIPVWPQELIVHIDRENQVYRIDGQLQAVPQFTLPPKLTTQDAMLKAINSMAPKKGQWAAKNSKLYIYQHKHTPATLAYQVEINQGLFRQFVFIDADDGTVVHRIEGVQNTRLFDE